MFGKEQPEKKMDKKKLLLFDGPPIPFVVNGDFETDPNIEWTAVDCTLASIIGGIAGNCLQLTMTGGIFQNSTQEILDDLIIGQRYIFRCWVKSGTSGNEAARILVIDTSLTEGYTTFLASAAGWTEYTVIFTPVAFSRWFVQVSKDTPTAGTMLFDGAQLLEY